MQIDRRLITHFDWTFVATLLALTGVGILSIYSANVLAASAFRKSLYLRQLTWLGIGLIGLVLACTVSYRNLARVAYVLFGVTLVGLLIVLVLGKTGLGAQRWIRIGPVTIQPSEFAKLALILFLARYFDDHRDALRRPRILLLPAGLIAAEMLLVLKQPDLGTAILLGFIAVGMFLLVGLRLRYLLPFAIGGAVLAPVVWTFLKEYQQRRILVFLNPDIDPLGASYHIAQSKIAVGSGGLLGKGWLGATQSQLNFLPLNHTDFIFAVLSEQWGFLGCLAILVTFFFLVSRGIRIAQDCTDMFACLLAAGISLMLGIQVLVNVGMVLGMLPVVGIPLPLVSYGGSSLVVTLLSMGLLMNIHMRRFMY